MRAFLGIPLPADLREELARAARAIDGLRAQKPDTIHLTVRFLGEIRDHRPIAAALEPVAAAHSPFEMALRGLGAFPDRRKASVVWVRVEDGAMEAGSLAAGIEDALLPLGFERERRVFKAHITLGRFRSPRRLRQEILDPDRDFGRAVADRLVLYESTLTPEGAIHTPVRELSLGRGM